MTQFGKPPEKRQDGSRRVRRSDKSGASRRDRAQYAQTPPRTPRPLPDFDVAAAMRDVADVLARLRTEEPRGAADLDGDEAAEVDAHRRLRGDVETLAAEIAANQKMLDELKREPAFSGDAPVPTTAELVPERTGDDVVDYFRSRPDDVGGLKIGERADRVAALKRELKDLAAARERPERPRSAQRPRSRPEPRRSEPREPTRNNIDRDFADDGPARSFDREAEARRGPRARREEERRRDEEPSERRRPRRGSAAEARREQRRAWGVEESKEVW